MDLSGGVVKAAVFSEAGDNLVTSAYVRLKPGSRPSEGLREALPGLLAALSKAAGGAGGAGGGGEGGPVEKGKAPEEDFGGVFGDVYLSLPPTELSLRVLTLPFTDRSRIKEVLPFELSGSLPFDVSDAVVDGVLLGDGKVLAVAMEKSVLSGYLDALEGSGLDPAWVGTAFLSMPGYIEDLYKPGGTAAFISRDLLTVGREGKTVFFNSFADPAGLKLSLNYLGAEGINIDKVFFEGVSDKALGQILGPGVTTERLALPGGSEGWLAGAFALMETLRKGKIGETVDLRTGEFEYTKRQALARKRLKLTAILAVFIAALLAGDLYLKYMRHSGELAAYELALRTEYLKLFPAERGKAGSIDGLYLLNAKLKALEGEAKVIGGGVSALKILSRLTDAAGASPEMKITLFEVAVGDGRLNARGEGASFEAANRYKEALSGLFMDVKLSDVSSKAAGGVSFSLTLTIT
jgi:type II secretory pathway component PulL